MVMAGLFSLVYPLLLAAFVVNCHGSERKVYIVYMGDLPQGHYPAASVHHSMLENILGSSSSAKESLIYSYGRSFNGFAVKLTEEEVEKISGMKGVVSVIPNRILKLHTTRSWDFMGFSKGKLGASQEGNVIIGVLDSGIWPESESFNDEGMSASPSKWKGTCQGANFSCNKKIIGARYYNSLDEYDEGDIKSPRDSEGHGTHTSSTAAGREVGGASYQGLAQGLARGGVPNARIAVYKVCWSYGCSSTDIMAAYDDAIADGVDIISVSLGDDWASAYFIDPIAIGAFHAMRHGILTSTSAGNTGPFPQTVSNSAPWLLTVAASTIDRQFVAKAVLGNGKIFTGLSINSFELNGTTYPLIWGGDAANYSTGSNQDISRYCHPGKLNSDKAAGKIVFCESLGDGSAILLVNGVGTIMADSYLSDVAFAYPLPATVISNEEGLEILDYIRSTDNPVATILVGETRKDILAPVIASFSPRGPHPITLDILKPDITAPGVDILAAWSPLAPSSIYWDDPQRFEYAIMSGTSVSCPHATGAAAYVKAAHPDWSAAAVKSALMTTAYIMDSKKHPDLEFAYGTGHINPLQAVDPGLIYDASEADFTQFLCKQGYNTTTVKWITGSNNSICNSSEPGRAWDLNYPTFALAVEDGQPIEGVFTRTVTNVGSPNSTYILNMYMPIPVNVSVEPSVLSFTHIGEKISFRVKIYGPKTMQQKIMSGAIIWEDGVHVVRSPLVVFNVLPGATNSSHGIPWSSSSRSNIFNAASLYHNNHILRLK